MNRTVGGQLFFWISIFIGIILHPPLYLLLLSYLCGSIPYGLLIVKALSLGDIRKVGSGNIGVTNVMRTGNKIAALLTLVCDVGKGLLAIMVVMSLPMVDDIPDITYWSGCCVILGHIFPVWLNFRGGKGIATAAGVFLYLTPISGLSAILTWIIVFIISRYSSLSSIIASVMLPIYIILFDMNEMLTVSGVFVSVIILLRHKSNIHRLLNGKEGKTII